MAIALNAGYNSPELAAVAQNIAQMFGPPSASELAGYSTAALNRQKHEQIAQLFGEGQTPSERAALVGIQNYGQTPQGFNYQVDQNNATQRYGFDTQAATSRANNLLDNQTRFLNSAFGPEGGPAIPDGMAATLGFPGAIDARPYSRPLTETQWKAKELEGLKQGGLDGEALKGYVLGAANGSAKEAQITRLQKNFMATGDIPDPVDAYNAAVGLVDGRLQQSRHPVTGELQIVDMATGRPAVFQGRVAAAEPQTSGDPVIDAVMAPSFGAPYPASGASFGVNGAVAGAINTATDALGLGVAYPEVQQTQADFRALRERLLSDMEDAYGGRQPPSWLMQEIRNLTPDAGNPLEGGGQAQAKLMAIGRQVESQIALTQQQLQGQLTPARRQELEGQLQGLQASVFSMRRALSSFVSPAGGAQANGPTDAPPGVDPDDWNYMTDEEKALFQ